jgi:hypothetical protein
MCLIIACTPGNRPSANTLKSSRVRNNDGSGIAWTDNGRVHWIKGLSKEEVDAALATVPNTAHIVIHDRLSTIGGNDPALTHPFFLNGALPKKSGSTKGTLLFHNGHFSDWRTLLLTALGSRRLLMPKGVWSDSRAIGILFGIYGPEIMSMLDGQRVCTLSPDGFKLYGQTWTDWEGCKVSNRNFAACSPPVQSYNSADDYGAFGFGATIIGPRDNDSGKLAEQYRAAEKKRQRDNRKGKSGKWNGKVWSARECDCTKPDRVDYYTANGTTWSYCRLCGHNMPRKESAATLLCTCKDSEYQKDLKDFWYCLACNRYADGDTAEALDKLTAEVALPPAGVFEERAAIEDAARSAQAMEERAEVITVENDMRIDRPRNRIDALNKNLERMQASGKDVWRWTGGKRGNWNLVPLSLLNANTPCEVCGSKETHLGLCSKCEVDMIKGGV